MDNNFFVWFEALLLKIVEMFKQTKKWFDETNFEDALAEIQ